jgi:transposase-like protein
MEKVLEDRMDSSIDLYLEDLDRLGDTDRRNGHYSRHLLTELGDIELGFPLVWAFWRTGERRSLITV